MITIQWQSGNLNAVLKGIEGALTDLRPAWGDVDKIVAKFMAEVFRAEGAYAGSKWKPLNKAYAVQKARKWGAKPILQASGALMRSFVNADDPDHVMRVGPTFGEFGSRKRYAKAHHFGYPPNNLPSRPLLRRFTKIEGEMVVDAILAHIFKAARRAL
jgi:hypothetical protein